MVPLLYKLYCGFCLFYWGFWRQLITHLINVYSVADILLIFRFSEVKALWSIPLGISVSDGRNRVVSGIHCIIGGCTVLDTSVTPVSLAFILQSQRVSTHGQLLNCRSRTNEEWAVRILGLELDLNFPNIGQKNHTVNFSNMGIYTPSCLKEIPIIFKSLICQFEGIPQKS